MEYSLEFDGSTVLCRVCGDKASGFHYGVHTCEGCKGFFRRSIQQKLQYKPCTKNQQCSVLRINRNRCQYCRLKKCIAVGMSRDAVRFGRVPKREKAKILAAMQKVNQSSQEKMLNEQLLDEQSMLNAIFEAHNETCDFTNSKMASIFHKAEQNPIFADYPSQMTCPLNPLSAPSSPDSTQINDSFSPAIRGVVEFARRLPGFSSLPSEDQVTLLKAGVFEALLVRLAVLFRTSDKMYCLNGQILRRSDAVDSSQNGRFLFECMFEFGERVNALGLVDKDIALFSAVVLVTPDRPGLRNVEFVQKIHQKIDQLLMNQVASNHPDKPNLYTELKKKIPDLRTLNTLHSEKLLAIKMDSHNSATDGVVSTSSSSSASTPNYSYAEFYTNNFKCNQSVVSDWSDFGSPRSIGSSCDNESSKTLDLCPYSPSEQIAQFHLSSNHSSINSSNSNQHQNNSHVTSNNSVSSPGSSNSSCGSSNQMSSAGQISQRASSSLSNFSSSSNHSYSGALALHSSSIASSTASICSASSTNAERSSSVISKPRFGQLNCFFNGSASSSTSNAISVNSHHNLISSHHRNSDEEKISGLNRRVDSPADSGIESGKEGNSATSVCSSPRSDSEDHHQPQVSQTSQGQIQNSNNISTSSHVISSHHNNGSIDDMPMLKRALQAPPLLNTSSLLMDEAYRHHKKFRATKMQQAQRELEAQSPQSSSQTNLSTHDELVQQHQSLASTHSTLVKTLQQQPRFANEQQLKRTDLIHTIIMRGESGLNSKFGVLENNSYSADSSSLISSQMSSTSVTRSSIIHTTTSSQSTLQQLLAPKSQQPSSSIYSNGNLYNNTGSAPSPLKNNNQHISNNGSYSAAPLSPASSLVNNHSPPPPASSAGCGLLSNQPIFHYTPAPPHLYNGSNLDAHMSLPHHHHIHPMYAHHTSTSMLMEAQPLNLSKKSSAPITPPISPSNIKLES